MTVFLSEQSFGEEEVPTATVLPDTPTELPNFSLATPVIAVSVSCATSVQFRFGQVNTKHAPCCK